MAEAGPAGQRAASALSRVRLRHLQCLLAVAELGNLRRAAEALAVSQPAVTKTINELEDLLGVKLFVRGRRGAVPTPEAELFLRHAQASISALEQAVDSVVGGDVERTLRVGVLPTLAPSVMPRIAAAWRAARPAAVLRVETGLNTALLRALRARELDVVLGRLAEPDDMLGLTFELLWAEPLVLVARPGHALLESATPLLADIGACPLLLPLAGTVIRHGADSFLRSRHIVPRGGITETVSASLARAIVLGSDSLWFTPLSAAEPDLKSGALKRVPLDTTGTEEPVGLLMRADDVPTTTVQALAAAARTEAAARRKQRVT